MFLVHHWSFAFLLHMVAMFLQGSLYQSWSAPWPWVREKIRPSYIMARQVFLFSDLTAINVNSWWEENQKYKYIQISYHLLKPGWNRTKHRHIISLCLFISLSIQASGIYQSISNADISVCVCCLNVLCLSWSYTVMKIQLKEI